MSVLDSAVERNLLQMKRFGLLGAKRDPHPDRIDVEADAKVALRIAEAGAVLLKNDDGALPLNDQDMSSLALIGPTAGQLAAGFMGERAYGFEDRLVSPLQALRTSAPGANISYAPGINLTGMPIASSAFPDDTPKVDFALEAGAEYEWSGTIMVNGGDYTFLVQPAVGKGADGGGSIAIDGRPVARTGGPGFGGSGTVPRKWSSLLPTIDGRDNGRGAMTLAPGAHHIDIHAASTGEAPLPIRFGWITPEFRRAGIDAAVAIARNADTAVVFAWQGAGAFDLPEQQDELIARIAQNVRKTVVVLNTGGPVAMPWKRGASAILEMWYPGQEGGWATANLLLGRANPGGRLPVTFPADLGDAPARASGRPERTPQGGPPGAGGVEGAPAVKFSEGIAVGYRWYDQQNIEPLFSFGHGLSYTRFEYSGITVERHGNGCNVSFMMRNTGPRRGIEVAQVYIGPSARAPVPMAVKSLGGFERVELDAGSSRRVTIHVGSRQLSYWSTTQHNWALASGPRAVFVGASSRDIRLEGRCCVKQNGIERRTASRTASRINLEQ